MDIWRLGRNKEIGVERDRHQSGMINRYKEIEVDREEIEINIGGYTKNRMW